MGTVLDLKRDRANVGTVNPHPWRADAKTTFPFMGSKFHMDSSSLDDGGSCVIRSSRCDDDEHSE